ncbi:UNVERIFIED_CONTAM: hypothetical protein Sindi_1278600 [Sesamum indicum]
MTMRKLKHSQVPIWIKLRHLPMEYWTTEGLSTVASGVGKPLYPDAITRACTRLDYARVCVMLDATQELHKHIIIMTPDEDGGETPCKVDIEYEWLPQKFTTCMTLGHTEKDCAINKPHKPMKPPVTIYVPRDNIPPPPPPKKKRRMRLTSRNLMRVLWMLNEISPNTIIGKNLLGVLTHAAPVVMIHVEHRRVERPWSK